MFFLAVIGAILFILLLTRDADNLVFNSILIVWIIGQWTGAALIARRLRALSVNAVFSLLIYPTSIVIAYLTDIFIRLGVFNHVLGLILTLSLCLIGSDIGLKNKRITAK